jgi:hypothetical protein
MSNAQSQAALKAFNEAAQALIAHAKTVGHSGDATTIAEATQTLSTTNTQALAALKGGH